MKYLRGVDLEKDVFCMFQKADMRSVQAQQIEQRILIEGNIEPIRLIVRQGLNGEFWR